MFCPDCGNLMTPGPSGPSCDDCGTTGEGQKISHSSEGKEVTKIAQSEEVHTLPRTQDFGCPECDEQNAYYRFEQTRAADEQTTIILTCVECDHKWRHY